MRARQVYARSITPITMEPIFGTRTETSYVSATKDKDSPRLIRLSRTDMIAHAQEWVAAWNRRDVSAVIAAIAPAAQFRTPFAKKLVGTDLIVGIDAIGEYWVEAVRRIASNATAISNF